MHRLSLNIPQLLFVLIFLPFALLADTQQPGAPITIGGTCSDSDGSYLWITTTKTPWSVQDVAAVPSGTVDPGQWSNYPSFRTSLWAGLSGNPDANAFGQRIADISPSYFSNPGDLLVALKRTISTTTRNVTCQAGTWEVDSTASVTNEDDSDWIPAANSVDLSDGANDTVKIQDALDLLNGQPGASTAPTDGYVHLETASQGGQP